MDACSVAICKGLCMNKSNWNKAFTIGIYFATFQFIMPMIGYCFGNEFGNNIKLYSHLIAFVLLFLLGINMLKESFSNDDEFDDDVSFKAMIVPSIATSIDALSVGITFSLLDIDIITPCISIFIITFILSVLGTKVGQLFGNKYKCKSQMLGGIILIFISIKMLI